MTIAPPASAQGPALETRFGQWEGAGGFRTLEAVLAGSAIGPLWYSAGFLAAAEDAGPARRFLGLSVDLTLFKHQARLGPYLVAGTGLGVVANDSTQVAAVWSVGGGLEWNPFAFAGLQADVRYRALDPGVRGFWRLPADAPRGLAAALGVTFRWGYRAVPAPRQPGPLAAPTRVEGAAAGVAETALTLMGTPYRWGGTDENGFDCSGLIQHAYGEHGIVLPRTSRDQARAGRAVARDVGALAAGDILAFSSVPGGQVTHVGLYVGEGKFIHSASGGVILSRLSANDADGQWWWNRWVAARRVTEQ
jgi:hypothetical protein